MARKTRRLRKRRSSRRDPVAASLVSPQFRSRRVRDRTKDNPRRGRREEGDDDV